MSEPTSHGAWWGEGEIKFFMDGDQEFPTICGTGTEDYIGGAWNFEYPQGEYCRFSTPYSGLHQILKPDGLYQSQQRFGMYRFHLTDPIRFDEDLHVEIQAAGAAKGVTCRCRTTSLRSHTGIRPNRIACFLHCRKLKNWK